MINLILKFYIPILNAFFFVFTSTINIENFFAIFAYLITKCGANHNIVWFIIHIYSQSYKISLLIIFYIYKNKRFIYKYKSSKYFFY